MTFTFNAFALAKHISDLGCSGACPEGVVRGTTTTKARSVNTAKRGADQRVSILTDGAEAILLIEEEKTAAIF